MFHNFLSFLGTNIVCNLNCIFFIVHEKHLQVRQILDQKLVEPILNSVTSVLSRSETDVWHQCRTLELSANTPIDTTRLAPRLVHSFETICLETWELLHALLQHLGLHCRCRHDLRLYQAKCLDCRCFLEP